MSKQEFVDHLRTALSGKIPPALVEENARYYEDYINTQVRLGETESAVLESLGDPRLIARSIVAAESVKAEDGAADQERFETEEDAGRRGKIRRRLLHLADLPAWALPVLAVGMLLAFFLIVGLIFRLALHMLAWLWPVIAIVMLVLFFIKLFRDWLH